MPKVSTNYHTHTTYCDGSNSPREIAEEAARLGMTELGFSGHSYTSIDESYCMSKEGMRKYFSEIGDLAREFTADDSDKSSCTADTVSRPEDPGSASGSSGTNYGAASDKCCSPATGKHGIRILRGIEMDYFSDPEDYCFNWDHIICSCHYIKKDGNIFPVDESEDILMEACRKYYGGDIYSLIADYYAEAGNVIDVVRAGLRSAADQMAEPGTHSDQTHAASGARAAGDQMAGPGTAGRTPLIVGHFDLITKFNEGGKLFDEHDPRYVSAWTGALDRICSSCTGDHLCCLRSDGRECCSSSDNDCCRGKKKNACHDSRDQVLFEINTGAMSRGYRTSPYPAREILIEIGRRGMPVILSSDSHDKSTLLYGFDEALRLADECRVQVRPHL